MMCILVTGLKWRPQGGTQNKQRASVRLYWLSLPLTACRPSKYPVLASVQSMNSTKVFDTLRTTRTPAFWGYPPPPHDYPYYWFILDPKSKQDKVINLKNLPKLQISESWKKKPLHMTHLLKLLDKMCKYEMDPASIVEDTERTRFSPQTNRRIRWNQYTPL